MVEACCAALPEPQAVQQHRRYHPAHLHRHLCLQHADGAVAGGVACHRRRPTEAAVRHGAMWTADRSGVAAAVHSLKRMQVIVVMLLCDEDRKHRTAARVHQNMGGCTSRSAALPPSKQDTHTLSCGMPGSKPAHGSFKPLPRLPSQEDVKFRGRSDQFASKRFAKPPGRRMMATHQLTTVIGCEGSAARSSDGVPKWQCCLSGTA